MKTLVYNPYYDLIGLLDKTNNLIKFSDDFSMNMVYIPETWDIIGDL